MLKRLKIKKNRTESNDHLVHRADIIHHHSGSTFSEREVNIVLLIILAIILLLFWMPLAEFMQ
jgi:hypothetical protein